MHFAVIYTNSWNNERWNGKPPPDDQTWKLTEEYHEPEHDDDPDDEHRKWVHEGLTPAEFEAFVEECDLHFESGDTGGSLGLGVAGGGWAPAMSFTGQSEQYQSAYVTPVPDGVLTQELWLRTVHALKVKYG